MFDRDNSWSDHRRHVRFRVDLPALAIQDGYAVRGRVTNISSGGAQFLLEPVANIAIRNAPLDIDIEGVGRVPGTIRWRGRHRCGIVFDIAEQMRHHITIRLNRLAAQSEQQADQEARALIEPAAAINTPDHEPARPIDPPDVQGLRRQTRYACRIHARLHQDGYDIPCLVRDLSLGGARLALDASAQSALRDGPARVEIPSVGVYSVSFRWRKGGETGVKFNMTSHQARSLRETVRSKFESPPSIRTDG